MFSHTSAITESGRWALALTVCAATMVVVAGACRRDDARAARGESADEVRATATACAGAETQGALPWFHDAYDQARACAKARGVPLVLDMWAPWCHTCLSMQAFVLSDPGLAPLADRFVFAAIDTDRTDNASVVARFPVSTWPTFFVVSPEDESVQARFVGAASLAQWRELLAAGEAGHLDARAKTGGLAAGSPIALLRDGDRAVVARDLARAETAYSNALTAAPPGWPRRPDVLVSLIQVKQKRGDIAGCLDLALARMDETGRAASATDFLVYALRCAEDRATTEPDRARQLRERAAARLSALVDDPAAPLSADDRSDAMANLREALSALGREADARAVAERQRAILDEAAAKAPTPMAAMTYNWPRAEVYVYLGRPLELVSALEASAEALPKEYDPPYRLAWLLLKAGKPEQALMWAEKALARVYGPRKARAQALYADIQAARGDRTAERKAREDLVAIYQALPPELAQPEALAQAQKALAALAVDEHVDPRK